MNTCYQAFKETITTTITPTITIITTTTHYAKISPKVRYDGPSYYECIKCNVPMKNKKQKDDKNILYKNCKSENKANLPKKLLFDKINLPFKRPIRPCQFIKKMQKIYIYMLC